MSFDAGSISASLSVDTAKADADLAKIEARVKALEDEKHTVKISAVFDTASISRARAMFANLDNAVSRDAMQRLRASPQGSVLGALNALFSPHPVTGAPSAQQAASKGLLGQMTSQQATTGVTSKPGSATAQQGSSQQGTNLLKTVASGQQTTDQIKQVLTGATPGNIKTQDLITPKVVGSLPGDVTTTDTVKIVTTGEMPKNTDTTDTVHEKLDDSSAADTENKIKASGDRSGTGFAASFTSHISSVLSSVAGMFGGGGGDKIGSAAAASGAGAGKQFGTKLLDGIGPSILGISASTMFNKFVALGVGALAALPAAAGVAGLGVGTALVGGIAAAVAKGAISAVQPAVQAFQKLQSAAPGAAQTAALKAYQQQLAQLTPAQQALAKSLEGMQAAWQNFVQSNTAGVSKILSQGIGLMPGILASMSGIFKTVVPQISSIIPVLGSVIHGFLGIAQVAAPAFGPVINGLLKLIGNILPGIQAVIKAMLPFVQQFAGILATLGTHIGQLFSAAAPAIGASMKILGALLDLLGSLLPVIVKIGGAMATALVPIFTQLAGVVKALEPFLSILAGIFAQLAGAVLGDLVSAFGALATLLTAISPALSAFASSLGTVFTTLENSGVFAILGNAIEALAKPLAAFISALLNGLAPILPPLFTAIGQIAGILAGGLAAAVAAVLPPLTTLAVDVLAAIAKILPVVLPLITGLAAAFTGATVAVIQGVASALDAIIKAIPPGVIQALAVGFLAVLTAVKLLTPAMALLDVALNANPISLIAIAIAALGAAMYLAWEKSAGFRNVMKDIASGFLEAGIIIVQINKTIIDSVLTMFGDIIHGAADAFGWVPGIGGKLKGAAAAFDGFRGSVDDAFNKTIDTMQGWRNELSGALSTAHDKINTVSTDFQNQGKAADAAKTELDRYTQAVKDNGAGSDAAKAARQQLITDMTNAGVNASTAQTDVTNYSNAIAQNGVNSSQAQAARQQLVTDILNASNNAKQGMTDLQNYTTAVQQNGAQSTAAQAARAQLITDLENAGVNAKTATGLVDGLGTSISNLPKNTQLSINMTGTGSYTITQGTSGHAGGTPTGGRPGNAAGGIVPGGYGGGDSRLALVEPGETILPKEATSDPMTVAVAKKYGVPGFASGGVVGGNLTPAYVNHMYDDFKTQFQDAMIAQMRASIVAATAAAAAASTGGKTVAGGPSGTNAQNIALAKKMAAEYGWTGAEWTALLAIIMQESGGSATIKNPGSSASGIAQNIAGFGPGYEYGNAAQQIQWMLNYISSRYGDPIKAEAFHLANNYYADGGLINEPITGVGASGRTYKFGERGPEWVTPMTSGSGVPGQAGSDLSAKLDRNNALLERLIEVTGSLPHGISGGVGNALAGAAQSASFRSRYPRGGA